MTRQVTAPVYPRVDIIELGRYYTRHISAMTEEALHGKGDIAAQLAWRDRELDQLRARVDELETLAVLPSVVRIGWCPRCHVKSARFIDGQCQSCGEPSK